MMDEIEISLLEQISELDQSASETRSRITVLKKQLMDEESQMINCSISRGKLVEQLRVFRNEHYNPEMTDREEDIERFKKLLPDLLTKVK